MNITINRPHNCVWEVAKKTIPMAFFVNLFSMALAYAFYEMAFHVSLLPFWIAVGVLALAVLGPAVVVLIDGGQSRLAAHGLASMFVLATAYFFSGVVPFFFYFIFAPMPSYVHAAGLALGIGMTGYWMIFTARDVSKALATSTFVRDAFEDVGNVLQYRLGNVARLEAILSSRSPSGKLHMYLVLLVAPFSLVMGRILAPVFGPHGPILLGALIMFPASQWLAGIGVRQYIVMIRVSRMLERRHGKPVIAVSDEA